jgi:hypothetical protein
MAPLRVACYVRWWFVNPGLNYDASRATIVKPLRDQSLSGIVILVAGGNSLQVQRSRQKPPSLLPLTKLFLSNPANLISHPPSHLLIERRRDNVINGRVTDMLSDSAGSGQLHVGCERGHPAHHGRCRESRERC